MLSDVRCTRAELFLYISPTSLHIPGPVTKAVDCSLLAPKCSIRSNFNSRGVNSRECFWLFGHNFLGCGSYDLGIWNRFVLLCLLYLPVPVTGQNQAMGPSFYPEKFSSKKQCVHDYYLFSVFVVHEYWNFSIGMMPYGRTRRSSESQQKPRKPIE